METVANKAKKVPKGLATMIANSIGCTAVYVKQVLDGKHDERSTELVDRIKRIAKNVENELQTK